MRTEAEREREGELGGLRQFVRNLARTLWQAVSSWLATRSGQAVSSTLQLVSLASARLISPIKGFIFSAQDEWWTGGRAERGTGSGRDIGTARLAADSDWHRSPT